MMLHGEVDFSILTPLGVQLQNQHQLLRLRLTPWSNGSDEQIEAKSVDTETS